MPEHRRSQSKPDRGSVHLRLETFEQSGERVLTITVTALVRARPES